MGTINFKTGEFITLSIKPYDRDDFLNDADFLAYCDENDYTPDDIVDDEITLYYESDYENATAILNKYDFRYFDIAIESGYYESFCILVNDNMDYFDDYTERADAQKEITQIKKCLIELAGVGFVATFPFWCTTYYDYTKTLDEINSAIKEMRDAVKKNPTYNQYLRGITA